MDDDIPQQATHFFTQVDMGLFSKAEYRNFEELSQLARANDNVVAYDGLREAVRKSAWMVLAGRNLVGISAYFLKHDGDHPAGTIYTDFAAHADYERNLMEFVGYGKAALDGLAHFLNIFFQLEEKNQGADLKWAKFRERVADCAPETAIFFTENAEWLDKDGTSTSSVFATRDEWVHRGAPIIPRHFPAQDSGPLPIPRKLKLTRAQTMTQDELWTIEELTDYHLSRLNRLLQLCVVTAISTERKKSPDLSVDRTPGPATIFPLRLTVESALRRLILKVP